MQSKLEEQNGGNKGNIQISKSLNIACYLFKVIFIFVPVIVYFIEHLYSC